MMKKVSPAFAAIIIVFALLLGGLWFMVRYRNQQALETAKRDLLQKQAQKMWHSEGRMREIQRRQLMQMQEMGPGGQGMPGHPGMPGPGGEPSAAEEQAEESEQEAAEEQP